MNQFLQFTVLGIILGSVYAISATGLVVTYTTSGIFNFAHGAVGMIAAYCYWELAVVHGVPAVLAMVIVLVVGAPLAGLVIEGVLMRRLLGETGERPIMVTLGLLTILIGVALTIFGVDRGDLVSPLVSGQFSIFHVGVTYQELVIVVAAVLVAVAFRFLFHSLRLGIALRAVVDDSDLLAMSGASPSAMSRTGWVLGTFLAALAGVLLAQNSSISLNTSVLALLVVNSFAAAVVGRLRSVPMTYVGALILGLLITYFDSYAKSRLPNGLGNDISYALPMIFFFAALVALPSVRLRAVGRLSTLKPPRVAGGVESLVGGGIFLVAAVVFALTQPAAFLSGTSTAGTVASQTLLYGIVALSLVLIIGYAGQVSLCQFTFMGLGTLLMGKIAGGGSLVGLVAAVAFTAAIGALVALPAVRLRGLYLALATFAFADAVWVGVFPDPRAIGQGLNLYRMVLPGMSFASDRAEFILIAVAFVLCALVVLAIRRSLFGRRMVALNDSPAACATIGLNASFTKVAVFAIAAGMAGLAGALWGTTYQTVSTGDFDIFSGLMLLLFVTIWNIRTVTGAFLAALTFAVLNFVWPSGVGLFAGVGIVLIGRAPNGILGIPWLQFHLPWVKEPAAAAVQGVDPDASGSVLGGEVRAAG